MARKSKSLRSLPASDSKYWKHADINKTEIRETKCEHAFIRVSGTQIQCTKCHAGFMAYGPMPEVIERNLATGS